MDHSKDLPVGEKKDSATPLSFCNAVSAFNMADVSAVIKTLNETGLMDLMRSNPEAVLRGVSRVLNKEFGKNPAATEDAL